MSRTIDDRDRSRHRARLSGHTITAIAHVRVHRAAYVRINPPSVPNAFGSRAHEPLHDTPITRCEHGCPRRPRSQNRGSASSMRSPASPTTTAATPPTTASVPKSLPRCCRPPSCCSHHLQPKQRNPVAERGWVDVSFSSSHRVGSRSMRCLLEVIPRCVVAGGHSPRDIRSSLSVRRAHLRKFTRSVRRMYLLWFNASRVSYRVLTGPWRRRVSRDPSSRHSRAVPHAASSGTGVQSVARHLARPK